MHTKGHSDYPSLHLGWSPANAALTILLTLLFLVLLFLFLTLAAQPAQAQTFRVLHDFTGQGDGELPYSTPMVDAMGNVYGPVLSSTAPCRGCDGRSPVYLLHHTDSGWLFTVVASLNQASFAGLVHDAAGILYGTETADRGAVFELRPATRPPCCLAHWTETILYKFHTDDDGTSPNDLTMDAQGNLYGSTTWGGQYGGGTVFKLTRTSSGWTYELLYSFGSHGQDGSQPGGRVAVDAAGNIYGTAWSGGNYDCGVIFQVTPLGHETVLHYFTSDDGCGSASGLIFDGLGNLYGASAVLYELSPSSGGWTYRPVFRFPDGGSSNLVLDRAGNFYGAITFGGPTRSGEVFKLAPQDGGWQYTVLHDFSGPDGWGLYAGVALDSQGNLFGAGSQGGAYNFGVIFEITP